MLTELSVIKNNIEILNEQGELNGTVLLWNDSPFIVEIVNQIISISGVTPYILVGTDDNHKEVEGTIPLKREEFEAISGKVLIVSRQEKDVREFLRPTKESIYSLINYRYFDFLNEEMKNSFPKIELGELALKGIVTNEKQHYYLFPSKSVGDTYLPAKVLNELECEGGVAITICPAAGRILYPFRGLDVIRVSLNTMRGLELLYWANYLEMTDIVYMFPHPFENPCLGIGFWITQAAGYTFMDVCGTVFAGWGREIVKCNNRIEYQADNDQIFKLFADNSFIPGKTVLLVPNANSMPELCNEFWEKIAEYLKNRGFSVCTSVGSKNEKPIKNTKGVFIRLDDFRAFVKKAGYFLSVRCGLCDLLDGELIGSKKIILYVDRDMRYSSWYDYNDLERDAYDCEAKQIIVDNHSVTDNVNKVIKVIDEWWKV